MTTKMNTWVRTDLNEWELADRDGCWVTLTRERPMRYHRNGVSGFVADRQAPWLWTAIAAGGRGPQCEEVCAIPGGASIRVAKRLVESAMADAKGAS